MTSPKRQFRTLLAAIGLFLFSLAAVPAAQAEEAPAAPAAAAPAAFDPYAPGTNGPDVKMAPSGQHFNVKCSGRWVTIIGNSQNNRIYGTSAQDVIAGLGGRDLITAGEKNDFVCGGNGEDQVYGLEGNDVLRGEDQSDQAFGGAGGDFIYGDDGDDQADGQEGTDYLYGGEGFDSLDGGASSSTGGDGVAPIPAGIAGDSVDFVFGGPDADTITGGDNNDNLYGQGGNDSLAGDEGSDRMIGGPNRDTFDGGAGNDTMTGGPADDQFSGDAGFDTVWGDGGADIVFGGSDNDTVHGGDEEDLLMGESGRDNLYGDGGPDCILGGAESDSLFGGDGPDVLNGDASVADGSVPQLGTLDFLVPGAPWGRCSFAIPDGGQIYDNLLDGGQSFEDICVNPGDEHSVQTQNCEIDLISLTVRPVSVNSANGFVESDLVDLTSQAPINCAIEDGNPDGSGRCTITTLSGLTVTLSNFPSTGNGSFFDSWSTTGPVACPGIGDCVLTLVGDTTVTARFDCTNIVTVPATTSCTST